MDVFIVIGAGVCKRRDLLRHRRFIAAKKERPGLVLAKLMKPCGQYLIKNGVINKEFMILY